MTKRVVVLAVGGLLVVPFARAELPEWLESRQYGWFTPSVYLNVAGGISSSDHVEDLAVGHHDPTRKEGSVQGLELGLSMRAHKHLEGFATYNLHYGYEEEWEGEWEEAFLKLANLPGGFEIRGGRLLARYGAQNATHMHSWDFVDMPLAAGLLLGEDGISIDGGDITWSRRHRTLTYGIVAGFGAFLSHGHGHDHDDDHDDHSDAHGWDDTIAYSRLFGIYQPHDFVTWTLGFSAAMGDNEDHETRGVYGLDLTYQWRERGFDPGGRALRWTTELLVKSEKAAHEEDNEHAVREEDDEHAVREEDDEHGHHTAHLERETERGLYTQLIYSWNEKVDTGLRLAYVEGGAHGHDRYRVSPVATYRPFGAPGVALRLQYNYDDADHDQEHTVWAQVGLGWGGAEVR